MMLYTLQSETPDADQSGAVNAAGLEQVRASSETSTRQGEWEFK